MTETYLEPIEKIGYTFSHEKTFLIKNATIHFKLQKENKFSMFENKENDDNTGKQLMIKMIKEINKENIHKYIDRNLIWNFPKNLLSSLENSQNKNYLFSVSIQSAKNFFLGKSERIQFEISRNMQENINIYNRENLDYFLCPQKFSKDWMIIGDLQKKIKISDGDETCILEFRIIPLNVGSIELPKFRISSVKNNVLTYLSDLKQEDLEKIENDNIFYISNNELLIKYYNGNKVLVHGFEKQKAEFAIFI